MINTFHSSKSAAANPLVYHIEYIGKAWRLFGDLHAGCGTQTSHLTVTLDSTRGLAVIEPAGLPKGLTAPPRNLWPGGLEVLFPGTQYDEVFRLITVPIAQIISLFQVGPGSEAALNRLIALLPPSIAYLPPNPDIISRLKSWVDAHDDRWLVRHERALRTSKGKVRPEPKLRGAFLDAIVLCNWSQLKGEIYKELFMQEVAKAVTPISERDAQLVTDYKRLGNRISNDCAFFTYLKRRRFGQFRSGPMDAASYLRLNGYPRPSKKKDKNTASDIKPRDPVEALLEQMARTSD
jgi:hypothetical protein